MRPTISDYLETPHIFTFVDRLIRQQSSIFVVLRGAHGSGKTTVANMIKEQYGNVDVNVLNSSKLILILDELNLNQEDYISYILDPSFDRIPIVLTMKLQSPEVYYTRCSGRISIQTIEEQVKRQSEPVLPHYYGVFVPRSVYSHSQITPLHVTFRFLGRKQDDEELLAHIGKLVKLRVYAYNSKRTSDSLSVSIKSKSIPYRNETRPHITLASYHKMIGPEQQRVFERPFNIVGVFGMYA